MNFREAVAKVLEGFDKGIFVRNVEGDVASDWAVKAFPYLQALGKLAALTQAGEASMRTNDPVAAESPILATAWRGDSPTEAIWRAYVLGAKDAREGTERSHREVIEAVTDPALWGPAEPEKQEAQPT